MVGIARPMTYYEELGVDANASLEEIREAYRRLARLLHPDTLQDPNQRRLAECQMKRLNAVYHTLADEHSRRLYDLALRAGPAPHFHSILPLDWKSWLRWGCARWGKEAATLATLAVALLTGGVLWMGDKGASQPRTPAQELAVCSDVKLRSATDALQPSKSQHDALEQLRRLRRQYEQEKSLRERALRRVRELEQTPPTLAPARQAPVARLPAAPDIVIRLEDQQELLPPRFDQWRPIVREGFAGSWHYVRNQASAAGPGLYPPEFIETEIMEENGALRGHYRARYRINDRAISPDVIFQFNGKVQGETARLNWLGVGGARGELSLRLLSADELEVAWIAESLGTQLGLGSGRAVLIRRQQTW